VAEISGFCCYCLNEFNILRDYGFRDQIRRAVVSISNNVAEGFDRSSKADFIRFLYIALASCSEVKSMLYLAERLNYISAEIRIEFIKLAAEISRILTGLIKSLK
jgi:four helix bundle protein